MSFSCTCLEIDKGSHETEEGLRGDPGRGDLPPDEGTPLLAVAEVLLVLVDEPRVILAANQNYWRLGAESSNLMVPHGPE